MAKIELGPAPTLDDGAVYGEYLPWLLHEFYWNTCAYCLCHHVSLAIDHFVPTTFDPTRANDPDNLLPSCTGCNRAKSDYHPDHDARRRLPRDATGFLPIDVRVEDLATFFELKPSGELKAHNPDTIERATWHAVTLFHLTFDSWRKVRSELYEMLSVAGSLRRRAIPDEERAAPLGALVDYLARRWLLLHALDVPVDAELREMIVERRAALRESRESE